jgi:hypothetical protein
MSTNNPNDSVREVHLALDRYFTAYNDMNRWQAATPARVKAYKEAKAEYISAFFVAYGLIPRNV